jgi:hypothetical protein
MVYMCAHCGRRVESDSTEPYRCYGPIDRAEWAKLPVGAPHPKYVSKNSDGQEMCIGTMRPLKDFAE